MDSHNLAETPHKGQRQPLPLVYRYLQVCLLIVFANDVYCFSSSYSFLPQHLADADHTSGEISMAFGIYGIFSIALLILLLYANGMARVISTSLNFKYWVITISTAACGLGSILLTTTPDRYSMLLASKALQGAASAVYFSFTFILINKLYPLEYQGQTAAFITAGLTLGDSSGPVIAGVVYDKLGLRAAFGTQLLPNSLALLCLMPLLLWNKRPWNTHNSAVEFSSDKQAVDSDIEIVGAPSASIEPSCNQQDCKGRQHLCAHQSSQHEQVQAPRAGSPSAQQMRASSSALMIRITNDDDADASHHRDDAEDASVDAARPCASRLVCQDAAASEPTAADDTDTPARAVWNVVRSKPVLAECLLVFVCQVSRTALDILVPLVLADVSTSVVAVVFAAEALGSVLAPFLADSAVQMYGINSRKATLSIMLLMSAACATALYAGFHPICGKVEGLCPRDATGGVLQNIPWGLAAVMMLFGACHSSAETLIFGHLAEYVQTQQEGRKKLSSDVSMNVYVLFWIAGFTVGAYVAGIPSEQVFWQQAVVSGVMGVVVAVSAVVVNVPHLVSLVQQRVQD